MRLNWCRAISLTAGGAIVVAAIGAVLWTQAYPTSRLQEFNYVWTNALQVGHPEYQIWSKGDVSRQLFDISATVEVDSHSPSMVKGNVGSSSEVSTNMLGRITFTSLPQSPMGRHLKGFMGGRGSDLKAKNEAFVQAKALRSREIATVIVELASPLSEGKLEALTDFSVLEWKRFFLSGPQPLSGKPVYWWPGKGGCSATVLVDPRCDNHSAVSQFRQWVHRLSDEDQDNLAELGLDLQSLRDAAAQGQVFGFIANTFSRDQVLNLLAMPEVRTVQIVEHWVEEE
ncbi:hypothetical protein [Nonomuraea sp. NPDC050202]|uniref:hypothetical protein n=1 Tax=Nonomuraea sp. NPDC050202 TaxID=3155035 RepID=UPI0033F0A09F